MPNYEAFFDPNPDYRVPETRTVEDPFDAKAKLHRTLLSRQDDLIHLDPYIDKLVGEFVLSSLDPSANLTGFKTTELERVSMHWGKTVVNIKLLGLMLDNAINEEDLLRVYAGYRNIFPDTSVARTS